MNNEETEQLRQELEEMQSMHEDAMARINELTMDAEVARLEFEQVLDAMSDPTWVTNNDYEILRINSAFLDLLKVSRKEALRKKCFDLINCGHCNKGTCPMHQIKKKRQAIEMDVSLKIADRAEIPYLVTAMPFRGLTGEIIGMVQQFKNITERKRYEEALHEANAKLEDLATTDGLTSLPNRRVFDERLEQEWNRMRREKLPLSLIMCDVDFFKRYNDGYGHQAGDVCLVNIAACIDKCSRRPADLPARYGGEEFVVLLPNTQIEGAVAMAETIRSAISGLSLEHSWSKIGDTVSMSLGVASVYPSADKKVEAETLVELADKALYEAKETGRNRVVAAPVIDFS